MKDYKRKQPRENHGDIWLFALFLLLFMLASSGCVAVGPPYDTCEPACDEPSHNQYGGLRSACGELPPMIGDDC